MHQIVTIIFCILAIIAVLYAFRGINKLAFSLHYAGQNLIKLVINI